MPEPYKGSASVHVDAPPEAVWDLVSDVTNMGKWSPECRSASWLGGASSPTVGSRFRGRNKANWFRWSGNCKITVTDRGREFTFVRSAPGNLDGGTTWRYALEPENGGTKVTESFSQAKVPPMQFILRATVGVGDKRLQAMNDGVRTTLERLKAAAEQS